MNERQLFESALEIADPQARQAFLDKACQGDEALRARVAALLKSHATAGSFLDIPAADQMGPGTDSSLFNTIVGAPAGEQDTEHALAEAEFRKYLQPATRTGWLGRLGHYEIEAILGRGAFGIVAKAFDEKLHRVVAIKLMNPELASTSPPRKRFLREARASAAVRHEHIVNIYSVEEEPLPYLVMEFIPGQTLEQKLNGKGPLGLDEVLRLGQQMAQGLAAAHATGLIHRDIKPANILLEAGAEERVKITDFGLARAADDATITQSGVIAGTPMYMAPEQAYGHPLDQRADLFSLGSVLYQMISGRPPFRAETTLAVLRRVTEDTPRPIQDITPETPSWLCAIITKLHAKEPADRFQTAKELAELLGQCRKAVEYGSKPNLPWSAPATTVDLLSDRAAGVIRDPNASRNEVPRSLSGKLALIAGGVAILLLCVWLIIPLVNRNGGQTKIQVADGKKVEIVSNQASGGPAEAPPPAKDFPAKVSDAIDFAAERKAAEWVLKVGGNLTLVDAEGNGIALDGNQLPALPFAVNSVGLNGAFPIMDSDLENLAPCRGLTLVSAAGEWLTGHGLVHLSQASRLHTVHIASKQLTDEGLTSLRSLPQLKWLGVSSAPRLTNDTLRHIATLTQLHTLELAGLPGIDDDGLKQLDVLRQLIRFTLADSESITDRGLEPFCVSHPRLQILSIANPLQSTGRSLKVLAPLTELTEVGVSAGQLTPEAIDSLNQMINVVRLQVEGSFNDDDARRIAQLKRLKQVFFMPSERRSWNTTKVGWQAIATLPELESLVWYDPASPEFDDDCLIQFAAASKLRGIQMGQPPKLTAEGIAAFRKARPDVQLIIAGKEYPATVPAKPNVSMTKPAGVRPQVALDLTPPAPLGAWEMGPEPPWYEFQPFLQRDSLVIPGLLDRPRALPGLKRWNVDTVWPRCTVNVVRWSPDGKWIATGSQDGHVRIYDSATMKFHHLIPGIAHAIGVWDVSWHPDSQRLTMCSADFTVRTVSLDGTLLWEQFDHHSPAAAVVWNHAGTSLALGLGGGQYDKPTGFRIVNSDGMLTREIPGAVNAGVYSGNVCWSPDDQSLIAWHHDGKLRKWSVDSAAGAEFDDLGNAGHLGSLDLSHDGWLAVVTGQAVRVYGADCKFHHSIPADAHSAAWQPGNDRLLLCGPYLIIWDRKSQGEVTRSEYLPNRRVTWSPDGTRFVSADDNARLHLRRADLQTFIRKGLATKIPAIDLEWNSDGSQLASVAGYFPRIWTATGSQTCAFAENSDNGVLRLTWHPDGRTFLAGGGAHRIGVADGSGTMGKLFESDKLDGNYASFASIADGRWIAIGLSDGHVQIVDRNGQPVTKMATGGTGLVFVAWNQPTDCLAVAEIGQPLRMCHPQEGWTLKTVGKEPISPMQDPPIWSPDGQFLSVSGNGWFTAEGRRIADASSQSLALAWRLDSQQYVGASSRGPIAVAVRSPAGDLIQERVTNSLLCDAAWHPRGHLIAFGSTQSTITARDSSKLQPYWHAVLLPEGKAATFSAAGELLDGKPEEVDEYLVYYVDRGDGKIETLKPSEFRKLVSKTIGIP